MIPAIAGTILLIGCGGNILMELDWSQGELREGRRCYEAGAFFEAHEHWESVWLTARKPEKTLLQALIQVAAAFHHYQGGNCAGTASLLRSALRRLNAYPEEFAGIAVALVAQVSRLARCPIRFAPRCWALTWVQPNRAHLPNSSSRGGGGTTANFHINRTLFLPIGN